MVWRPPILDRADGGNWRAQLPPGSRLTVVTKIAETIDRCIPFSVPDGMNELRRIAARFEERVFMSAVDQIDYLRIIAAKMVTMETKYQSSANNGAPSGSVLCRFPHFCCCFAVSVLRCSDPWKPAEFSPQVLSFEDKLMDDNNRRPTLPGGEPAMDAGDWRAQLPPDSRQKIVNEILETFKNHIPCSGPEGINDLRRIAARFEEKNFSSAVNQTDYLRNIKMLTVENKPQNNAAGSTTSISTASNGMPLDSGNNN